MALGDWKENEVKMPEHRNYEEALNDAKRRLHDEELAALANLALIRSTFAQRKQNTEAARDASLEERLESLVNDVLPDHRPQGR